MIVEVDSETLRRRRSCATSWSTTAARFINPMIVEGQIHGGVAQGIGNAFFEQLVCDEQGQLLNAILMDYLLPTALDVPRMELHHTVTPSPLNPLGTKGAGEAGASRSARCSPRPSRTRSDLPARGIEITEIPLSPSRLWEIVHGGA